MNLYFCTYAIKQRPKSMSCHTLYATRPILVILYLPSSVSGTVNGVSHSITF